MNPWDEEAYREINDLEAARLAIRGALATIRDLQDLNARLKGTLQEAAAKEKLSLREIAELTQQLRAQRDEEILSTLKSRETELEAKERQYQEALRKNEELSRLLAAGAQEIHARLQDKEEVLRREYRAREIQLQERYNKRE